MIKNEINSMDERLGKEYKLCSRKRIQLVFKEGKTVRSFPFTCSYSKIESDSKTPFQIVVSAPKRLFRKAHDRNYVKRLMKEAIRKNKLTLETFLEVNQLQLDLFLVYSSKEVLELNRLTQSIEKLFKTIIHEFEKAKIEY